MSDPNDAQPSAQIHRRTVARSAAWAAPAATLVAAAPAWASSPAPGLQGWIEWRRSCTNGVVTLTVDGNGPNNVVYPTSNYGFYVFNTTPTTTLSGACVSWSYSPNYNGQITWTPLAGSGSAWSLPTFNAATGRWTTCYTGTWTHVPASGGRPSYSITTQVPVFQGRATVSQCATSRTIAITRCVNVNGSSVCFDRSVVV